MRWMMELPFEIFWDKVKKKASSTDCGGMSDGIFEILFIAAYINSSRKAYKQELPQTHD
jgi:hypothetical protein